ncbi:MAG: Bpu10I family restriction endonuclease [Chloroherpetonaceae bacterium]|nr:Bpu10I family restriction endonuclease [Chloroherpetonaceae bacterium]MDW8436905.1 Bpu10I family restriction endonuclease [Chloroherpetonaceae bacterium]
MKSIIAQHAQPHRRILESKKFKDPNIEKAIWDCYEKWSERSQTLSSERVEELEEKVKLLNEYKNFIDQVEKERFKPQDKIASSVLEEFLYYLFKDIPAVKFNLERNALHLGMAKIYTDLSFASRNLKDFTQSAGVYVNQKNQDFTISKVVRCQFGVQQNDPETIEIFVPAVCVECKTYLPSTMLGQSDYEAHRVKQGNPYSLYVIVAEQNALSETAMLRNSKIDEIFILRKQKRNSKQRLSDKKPIDCDVVRELYEFVKSYLHAEWFNPENATEKGRLIKN